MFTFFLKRLATLIPTVIGITLVAFGLIRLIPGDPIEVMMGERRLDPEAHAALVHRMGLDQPLPVQYWDYITKLAHGDLGQSLVSREPVSKEFAVLFPATVELALSALLIAVTMAAYLPYLSAGKGVFGFLAGYVAEEQLGSGGGFRYLAMLQRLVGTIPGGTAIYIVCAAGVLAGLALKVGFHIDRSPATSIRALGVLLLAFMLLLTPHYPWYYLVLGPFLVLTSWLTPWVLMTGGFVLYDVVANDQMPPFLFRETTLHLTALAAAGYDVWRARYAFPQLLQRDEVHP